MKLITRYILTKCFQNTTMLLFAFSIIYAVVQAIQELSSVGKGSYSTLSMFIYLGALLPSYIYLLIPLSVLIGVMTTMLGLVKNSEYAIMRTSGLSLQDIIKVLAVFGIFFAVVTFALGEVIAPEGSHFAKVYKVNKTEEHVAMDLQSGVWSKDGQQNIINVKHIDSNDHNKIADIQIFSYNDDQALQKHILAERGEYNYKTNSWDLFNTTVYTYNKNKIDIQKLEQFSWKSNIEPNYFDVLAIAPDDMPAFHLVKYISHLKTNHEATNRHEIALWNKLLYPIACLSMALIAIGFIPNNGRNINLSTKLFAGILIGVAFFFVNKLVGFMAALYMWNPVLSASIPTIVLFVIGWIVILKKEA